MISNNIIALLFNFIIGFFMFMFMYVMSYQPSFVEANIKSYTILFILVASFLCMVSGYLFLKPIKYAYLSGLAGIVIFLVILILEFISGEPIAVDYGYVNPIFIAVFGTTNYTDIYELGDTFYKIMLVIAFIPSLLMYVGILLRQKFRPRKTEKILVAGEKKE